jgi:cell division protein FtsB
MRELQERQKIKKRLYSKPVLLILVAVTLLIMRGTYVVMKKERESARVVAVLQAKADELALRQTELKTSITRLETDEGIEGEIKERFNVSRPGEYVVVIVDAKDKASTTATTTTLWYKRLWSKF